jgi:hypothetical protein
MDGAIYIQKTDLFKFILNGYQNFHQIYLRDDNNAFERADK